MSPAPATKHQTVSRLLQYQLMTQIEMKQRGQIFNAPTDVELAKHDIVQPDLIVVMNERISIINPKKIDGVPSLVIEILSESNPKHDQVLKLEMYQRTGVPEYWIVDPDRETVHQYVLVDGFYDLQSVEHAAICPATIADVHIDLLDAWSSHST